MSIRRIMTGPDRSSGLRKHEASGPHCVRSIRQRLNKLGSLEQHPPRRLELPARYRAPQPAAASSPRVSIVTPTLNQARFLAATIDSVCEQGYPNLEYWIQDGGSADGTIDVLGAHDECVMGWSSAPDSGQAQALNRGFAHSPGEIMSYLNSDDLLLPGALAYVARFFARRPDVDVVYGHRVLIDEQGRQIGRHVLPPHSDRVLAWADFIPQETLFWRRSIWEAAGAHFDEELNNAIDWELLLRLRAAGARMVRVPRFLGAFRVHPAQKTQADEAQSRAEMDRLRRRQHGRPVTQQEVLRRVRRYLARHVVYDRLYGLGLLRY
jgi:glycosyltransferase involved in cell wall biosynthesis